MSAWKPVPEPGQNGKDQSDANFKAPGGCDRSSLIARLDHLDERTYPRSK